MAVGFWIELSGTGGLVIIIKINFFSFYDPTVYNYFNFLIMLKLLHVWTWGTTAEEFLN